LIDWPDLRPVLGDIPWAVVGAVATRLYMPERATTDIDIAILTGDSSKASERLLASGYKPVTSLSIGGSNWLSPAGREVDVLELDEPWASRALEDARNNRDADGLPVVPFQYLILMKMRASRGRDIGDVTHMLAYANDEQLEETRQLIATWQPDLSEDLESFITMGKLEQQQQ